MSEIYSRGLNAGAFAVRGGDIRIKTGGMQLYALFPERRQTIDEKAVNLPDAKKCAIYHISAFSSSLGLWEKTGSPPAQLSLQAT
ncbi:hypothetical protein [Klebsiella michiganensis]|uniref:hypothetical protein n=1 Tax=Klebsiella michiganensis TaxID=1134687 RepID=UPI0025945E5C|nr:hypothetical protein [Klebsiella michiganensis]MDM4529580.1 hypothetical protein [Klebsiella michiganensis]MDM4540602.1 hypothetical protein [Klebsiella michiganensis]HBK4603587.1 hypothetical protein [Klebsiella michiganensis]HBK4637117.1 hypothetical protein [Klebsiella michiganensis]HBK4760745.1 hypothetical protein [Klebsiella michiganensis]